MLNLDDYIIIHAIIKGQKSLQQAKNTLEMPRHCYYTKIIDFYSEL